MYTHFVFFYTYCLTSHFLPIIFCISTCPNIPQAALLSCTLPCLYSHPNVHFYNNEYFPFIFTKALHISALFVLLLLLLPDTFYTSTFSHLYTLFFSTYFCNNNILLIPSHINFVPSRPLHQLSCSCVQCLACIYFPTFI